MRREFEDLSYNLKDDDMVPGLGSPRGFVGSVLASYVPRQEKRLHHGGRFLRRGREFPGPIFPESG